MYQTTLTLFTLANILLVNIVSSQEPFGQVYGENCGKSLFQVGTLSNSVSPTHNISSISIRLPQPATVKIYNKVTPRLSAGKASTRIVGGRIADIKSFPFFALLELQDERDLKYYRCGSSIISNKVLITAAHCLAYKLVTTEFKLSFANMGNVRDVEDQGSFAYYGISSVFSSVDWGNKAKIWQFVTHPDYEDWGSYQNDLGLVKLVDDIQFSELAFPVCLPKNDMDEFWK